MFADTAAICFQSLFVRQHSRRVLHGRIFPYLWIWWLQPCARNGFQASGEHGLHSNAEKKTHKQHENQHFLIFCKKLFEMDHEPPHQQPVGHIQRVCGTIAKEIRKPWAFSRLSYPTWIYFATGNKPARHRNYTGANPMHIRWQNVQKIGSTCAIWTRYVQARFSQIRRRLIRVACVILVSKKEQLWIVQMTASEIKHWFDSI